MATTTSVPVAAPLLPESSSSESVGVETVLSDMKDGIITIPDYQRDGNQWDIETKSLLIESVINNLTIPALFLEFKLGPDGVERSEVVDGQQRLTTLQSFHEGDFSLVSAEDAPYLSPNSIHYSGKTFESLPAAYKQAFKRYRLTVIRLRNLGEMRLEVFRRINQGGTPLSGQDIRLAYFGEGSRSVAFIRLVGIHDEKLSTASNRFIENAKEQYGIASPWADKLAFDSWCDWWTDKDIARGQTPSEMFIWSLATSQVEEIDSLLSNKGALECINVRFNNIIAEVLDAYCAQINYQDIHADEPSLLYPFERMANEFFPHFQSWIDFFLREAGVSLSVGKHRMLGCLIGALYRLHKRPSDVSDDAAMELTNLVRGSKQVATKYGVSWPASKGRWLGEKGHRAQFRTAFELVGKIVD